MASFYDLSQRLFLECKGLSDARLASITKKEYAFAVQFLKRLIKSYHKINI